tara:strand:- start:2811 stop:3293 length:483 start_codon:yes stop_codon:yes gene_type:complete
VIKVSSLELDMSLQKKIEDKLSEALKKKDKNVFSTLRLVISAIKDTAIANRTKGKEMSDSDITHILKKMVKQRNDSCEAYKKAGRKDLLEVENKEIEVIKAFLPKQLSEEETKKICEDTIKKLGASSIKDMGKVMGELKSNFGDVLDFSKVSSVIKGILK